MANFDPTYIPIIISAVLTPNPATIGQAVLISVAAADLEVIPREDIWYAAEVTAGEV